MRPPTRSGRGAARGLRVRSTPRLALGLALSLGAALLGAHPASAQGRSLEYQIKAVFLYNFVQFAQWPASAFASDEEPVRIGVLGEDPFGGALDEAVRGETIRNRKLLVRYSRDVSELSRSHLLFISKSERERARDILSELEPGAVLTVGEFEGFAGLGGGINFYLEGKKVRFEINPDSARIRGIRLSSQLLALGRIVAGEPRGGAE